MATVYVDGETVGRWYTPRFNKFLRWADADIDIPASMTAGKKTLTIRIVPASRGEACCWTDFRYEVFVHTPAGR